MEGASVIRRHGGIVSDQVIPAPLYRANIAVLQPFETMQVGSGGGVHDIRRQHGVRRMAAIPQDQAGPVLSWITALFLSLHLGRLDRPVLMLDHHDRFRDVLVDIQGGNVIEHDKIAVQK